MGAQAVGCQGIMDDSSLSVTLTVGQLKKIIRQEVQQASGENGHHNGDRLLDAEETATILRVSPDWLYKHHRKLPFARRLGPKMLRFSYQGIQKWLATRKPS